MKIVAIIQARMTSTRLPGKVMMGIEGKPMLWHLVNRLRKSKCINEIILALPETKGNDVLEEFSQQNNIGYYRGSEDNVLLRYFETAKKFKADIIVRITSDCPLIDPEIVDKVIDKHLNTGADFTANLREGQGEKRTFPRGLDVEVFSFAALEKVNLNAKSDFQREHIDPYFFENQNEFKIESVHNEKDLSALRWTVDEMKDLEFVREVYKNLYKEEQIFFMEDVILLLEAKPWISEINKDIQQKKI